MTLRDLRAEHQQVIFLYLQLDIIGPVFVFAMHAVSLVLLVLPSEPFPSEIKCNPLEGRLICLSFCCTQSQQPPKRIYHVTSESECLKDPMTCQ